MKGISKMRRAAGITQAALASKLGVSQAMVSDWESAKKYPSAGKLPLIAKTLNCTIDDLYDGQSA